MTNQSGRFSAKPGVDWNAIRAGFEAGEAINELARQHKITRRSIQKRRDKEGWDTKSAAYAAATRLPSVIAQATGVATTKARTEERAKKVIESLLNGLPQKTAAALAGIAESTLIQWRQEDHVFNDLCARSVEAWHAEKLEEIDTAGKRGDWKASSYRLERHHETRSIYAQRGDGNPNIVIQINVDRSGQEPETVTITTGAQDEPA